VSRKEKKCPFTKERAKVAEEDREILIEPTPVVVEPVRVHTLINGHMDPINAALYIGRRPHTLAQWRCEGRGPDYVRVNGRIFYPKADLDRFIAGEKPQVAE
jgi:hypothetical protein